MIKISTAIQMVLHKSLANVTKKSYLELVK